MSQKIKINYYDSFKCTADKCQFNCCQEWRIAIDEETIEKWQGRSLMEVDTAYEKLPALDLCSCLKDDDAGKILAFNEDKNCPFLNGKGLCRLVGEIGEDFLAETCTTFPRQINEFENRTEYSLDACCPAVIDIMYHNKEISFLNATLEDEDLLFMIRQMMIETIQHKDYSIPESMMVIFYRLHDLLRKRKLEARHVKECSSKAYLDELIMAIRNMPYDQYESFIEQNELFLDVVENYRKNELYVEYLEEISQFAEALELNYDEDELIEKAIAFEIAFSEYENLMRHYLVSELFGNGLTEDMMLEDLVASFEWITMEYVAMKQAIFLKWLMLGEDNLPYDIVRDYIMIISRVTGYDHEDIMAYLENSFEEMIWDWGYLALAVGNGKM